MSNAPLIFSEAVSKFSSKNYNMSFIYKGYSILVCVDEIDDAQTPFMGETHIATSDCIHTRDCEGSLIDCIDRGKRFVDNDILHPRKPLTAKQLAVVLGHKTYIGKQCPHGHDGVRYTNSGKCCGCEKDASKKHYNKLKTK